MSNPRLSSLGIVELATLLESKDVSPVDIAEDVLARIQELNGRLNAYVYVEPEVVREQARQAEKEIHRGSYRGPLHGIPVSLKDIFLTAGVPTKAGSKILGDFIPTEDATVVRRLRRAGAIFVGKTNLSEFAYGAETNNPHFGRSLNPWDTHRIPGGSSGGSAVAVAALMCSASLGTDTGGSIRIPSALCGVVGLKPTYGRVSCHGVLPLSSTLDHVGPITRSVLDAAIVLQVIAGYDRLDKFSFRKPVPDYLSEVKQKRKRLRLGLPREYFFDHLHPEVSSAIRAAFKVFAKLGGCLDEVSLPHVSEAMKLSNNLLHAEATSTHQLAGYFPSRAADYAPDVRQRLEDGARVLATDYLHALQLRNLAREDFDKALTNVDAIVVPTVPIPAPQISEEMVRVNSHKETVRAALVRLNRPANLVGLPAITVPCGMTRARLPIGLQIIGRPFEESAILRIARSYEKATEWHLQRPAAL
jgi:aspartyl-tRNA(Asn)/glutamyl-tRNA(Gln) amidotransferase subunit A